MATCGCNHSMMDWGQGWTESRIVEQNDRWTSDWSFGASSSNKKEKAAKGLCNFPAFTTEQLPCLQNEE